MTTPTFTGRPGTQLPGPTGLPLLGWRTTGIQVALDPPGYLLHLYQTYGTLVTGAKGTTDYVFTFSPAYNRELMNETSLYYHTSVEEGTMPTMYPPDSAMNRMMMGLNSQNGDRHKQQRRLMMPAFHKKRVDAYRDEMLALTEQKMADWQPGQPRDLVLEFRRLTLSIAVKTLLGLDPDLAGEKTRRMIDHWMTTAFSIPVMLLPFNIPGLPFNRLLKFGEKMEAEFLEIIRRKRAQGLEGNDVLSMLLTSVDEEGGKFSDEELPGHVATLFIAGHETTASALTSAVFLLAQHPPVLADLLDELDGHLHGDAPRVEQLNSLPLLEAVIKETMRLLPPALWSTRVNNAPCTLGGYDFPRHTQFVYSPFITHRLPEIYEQPARFMPARWQHLDLSPYEYMPFASGPRMCIGATFAMMEMKIVLATVLQRYRFQLIPGVRLDRGGFLLSSLKSLPVQLAAPYRSFPKETVRGNIHKLVDLA